MMQAKMILRDVMEDLDEEAIGYNKNIHVGIMIETPSAALTAFTLARDVDFFSIGTNDLTQYTLAVDRGNELVSTLYSAVDPAVLRLIRTVIQDAYKAQIDISICGEMASEPEYIMLMLGMGVRTMSLAPPMIPEIKQIIRSVTIEDCNDVARKILALNKTILVLVKFRIRGNLRFLSHAETVKVFQRACVRAGIKTAYSQGFNPRPKMSLPLPRSVGVEADDDLLCIRVYDIRDTTYDMRDKLAEQLPDGCELLTVSVAEDKKPNAVSATYMLVIRPEYLDDNLKTRIDNLLASESLNLERRIDARGNTRNIDVRSFLESIELDDGRITVECKISPAGSIRVDEILNLLELDAEKLAAPIRRTTVQWKGN
jgi:radical SAM-linked protein